jgi:hypothetical protein
MEVSMKMYWGLWFMRKRAMKDSKVPTMMAKRICAEMKMGMEKYNS